jgi:two-component sensor histidine kinase
MNSFVKGLALLYLLGNATGAFSQKLTRAEADALLEKVHSQSVNDTVKVFALSRLIDAATDKPMAGEYTDRFYDLVKKTPDPRGLGEYFNKLAIDTYLEGNFKEAIPIARTGVKIHRKFGDAKDYMAAINGLSNFLITEEHFTESVELCTRTLVEYKDYPECNEKNGLYLWRGIAYLDLKKYRGALADFNKALAYYRKVKHDAGEISAYQQIAKCYLGMNELQSASEYNERIIRHPGFRKLVGANKVLFLDQSGFIYFKRKMYDRSLASLKKALAVCPVKHEFLVNQVRSNTALCLFFMGQEEEGARMARKVIAYGPGLEDFRKRDSYYVLGLYKFGKKEYQAAKSALDTTVRVANRIDKKGLGDIHNFDVVSDAKKKLSLIALAQHDAPESFALLEESYEEQQKKLAAAKDIQLHKEVNTFELGEKKREVKNLTKEQLRNKLEIKEQQQKMLLLIGSLLLLLLIIGFMYRGYLIKKRNARQMEEKKKIIEQQNQELEESLSERDVLLKEVHHRVKNNFQMVISLLRMQAEEGHAADVDTFLEEATSRILSMSLIHQNLYQSENLSAVNFKEYVEELAHYIRHAFKGSQDDLQFELGIPEVFFDIQTAIPLGLALNEMMLNTLKHVQGTVPVLKITIALHPKQTGHYELSYFDNGLKKQDNKAGDSFGTELITLLVQQIGGTLHIENSSNVAYKIQFSNLQ